MSFVLQQNEFENGKQNGTNDLLDNQSIILEFELFDKKIETELSLGHVSFSGVPENWLFVCSFNQNAQVHYGPTMMSKEKTHWKDPLVGLEGSEGSFQAKDALERSLRPL